MVNIKDFIVVDKTLPTIARIENHANDLAVAAAIPRRLIEEDLKSRIGEKNED